MQAIEYLNRWRQLQRVRWLQVAARHTPVHLKIWTPAYNFCSVSMSTDYSYPVPLPSAPRNSWAKSRHGESDKPTHRRAAAGRPRAKDRRRGGGRRCDLPITLSGSADCSPLS